MVIEAISPKRNQFSCCVISGSYEVYVRAFPDKGAKVLISYCVSHHTLHTKMLYRRPVNRYPFIGAQIIDFDEVPMIDVGWDSFRD